jgi:hypothetical protein
MMLSSKDDAMTLMNDYDTTRSLILTPLRRRYVIQGFRHGSTALFLSDDDTLECSCRPKLLGGRHGQEYRGFGTGSDNVITSVC